MANYARFGDSIQLPGAGIAVALDPSSGVSVSVLPAGTQMTTPSAVPAGGVPTVAPGGIAPSGIDQLPVKSMAVVGAVGYFLGKKRGEGGKWAAIGAGLGWYFRPIG